MEEPWLDQVAIHPLPGFFMLTPPKLTKMVCTLGPASATPEMVEKLIRAGMNVARMNFSHGDHDFHARNIAIVREVSERLGVPVAILQDLQGPKIRVGKLINGAVELQDGQLLRVQYAPEEDPSRAFLPVDYKELHQDISVGHRVLLDDGNFEMKVEGKDGDTLLCRVIHGGKLKSRKGVNFPDATLSIPSTTEKDIRDLLFGISQGVDYIALSFVKQAEDIIRLKMMLRALGASVPIVAKIELMSAIVGLSDICKEADAIMVARGDLGVECGFGQVARWQKHIVQEARKKGKPVIMATQMLESMIENRVPTKAEITDVANAVFDLADATMLSGESASGRFPEVAVQTMRAILDAADGSGLLDVQDPSFDPPESEAEVTAQVVAQLVRKWHQQNAAGGRAQLAAVACLTLSGQMARALARYRLPCPIVAISPRPDVVRQLALVRGVVGVQNPVFYNSDDAFQGVGRMLGGMGLAEPGDLVVITGGIPVTGMSPTNTMKIHTMTLDDCSRTPDPVSFPA